MTVSREMRVPPYVRQLSQVIHRLTPAELNQLVRLAPELQRAGSTETLEAEQEAMAYFRSAAMDITGGKLPSPQDEFLEGLTYQAYFGLSEANQDALWERIFAEETTGPYDLEEHDARPDARVAAR